MKARRESWADYPISPIYNETNEVAVCQMSRHNLAILVQRGGDTFDVNSPPVSLFLSCHARAFVTFLHDHACPSFSNFQLKRYNAKFVSLKSLNSKNITGNKIERKEIQYLHFAHFEFFLKA